MNTSYLTKLGVIAFIFFYACSAPKYLEEKEKLYNTDGKNYWVFHRLCDRDKGLSLAFPGYIIGIEKSKRKLIGAPTMKYLKEGDALRHLGYNEDTYLWEPMPYGKREVLDDVKATFISHIKEFKYDGNVMSSIQMNSFYDIYNDEDVVPTHAFENGNKQLEEFGKKLRQQIKDENISHVFFYVMGWNSGQIEAIRNFNSLFLKTLERAKNEPNFKPLFIGLTWPSHWNESSLNVTSFFNKTNDADEIGMMWANLLLNRELLNTEYDTKVKTVVLGHSFGAKLTSRAVMSASMLQNESRPVDLLINLQSAYSINRFSPDSFEETEDYYNWKKYTNHLALVWSKYDKAVTKGFYAPFAGGPKAHRRVTSPETSKFFKEFETYTYSENTPVVFDKSKKQIFLIDGSNVVKFNAHYKSGNAHSDIYNDDVADLLWDLIKSSTI